MKHLKERGRVVVSIFGVLGVRNKLLDRDVSVRNPHASAAAIVGESSSFLLSHPTLMNGYAKDPIRKIRMRL